MSTRPFIEELALNCRREAKVKHTMRCLIEGSNTLSTIWYSLIFLVFLKFAIFYKKYSLPIKLYQIVVRVVDPSIKHLVVRLIYEAFYRSIKAPVNDLPLYHHRELLMCLRSNIS